MAVYIDVNPDLKSRVDRYLLQFVVNRHKHDISVYWERKLQNYRYRIEGHQAQLEGYFNRLRDGTRSSHDPATRTPTGIKRNAAKLYQNIRDELLTKRLCSQYQSEGDGRARVLATNSTSETIFHRLVSRSSASGGIVNKRRQEFYRYFDENHKRFLETRMPSLFGRFSDYEIAKAARLAFGIKSVFDGSSPDNEGLHVLEIGAGGCLLCVMLHQLRPIKGYDIIDLPEMIPTGFLIAKHFDDSLKIQLPGEAIDNPQIRFFVPETYDPEHADIDLGINITSFQEMNDQIVSSYFDLLRSASRPGGLLFCVNRLRKQTNFVEYPWGKYWRVISTEEDPLSRMSAANKIIIRRVASRVSHT